MGIKRRWYSENGLLEENVFDVKQYWGLAKAVEVENKEHQTIWEEHRNKRKINH